ncbi:MAG: DUF5658 family protein [Armatimonadota bacterium]
MPVYQPNPSLNTVSSTGSEIASPSQRRNGHKLRFKGPLHLRRAAERETLILLLISYIDMMTTLFWVSNGTAIEANPLLQWTFDHHPVAFVVVKMLATLPAIVLAPKLAEKHPKFTIWLIRAVIAVYLLVYFSSIR